MSYRKKTVTEYLGIHRLDLFLQFMYGVQKPYTDLETIPLLEQFLDLDTAFVNPVYAPRIQSVEASEEYLRMQHKARVVFVIQSVQGSNTGLYRDFLMKSAKFFTQR